MSDFQAIADRVEIEALRGEFSDAAMMRDRARLSLLFTLDGALRMPNIPVELVGREEIRVGGERLQAQWDFFVQTTHPGTIQLDGDTATGRAYIQELARTLDGREGLNYAVYHDRYQRTGDGWKFTERIYEVRYLDTTPLAGSAPHPIKTSANPPGETSTAKRSLGGHAKPSSPAPRTRQRRAGTFPFRGGQRMREVEATKFGGPEVLRIREVPTPSAGVGQAIVHVSVLPVLFLDTQIRQGDAQEWFPTTPPYVPGSGVAGTVSAVGEGVTPDWVGKDVVAATQGGSYLEDAAVAADSLIELPAGLGMQEAAALLTDGRTAMGLIEMAKIQANDRVLVLGAGGGLGVLLVQLAHGAGAQVIGAARGETKLALAKKLGSDAVVDYSQSGWTEHVMDVTGRAGPTVVFDGVGGDIGRAAFELTARGGQFSAHGAPSGNFTRIDKREAKQREIAVRGIEQVQFAPAKAKRLTERAFAEAAAGRIKPIIGQTFPLERSADAHRAIEARKTIGKTLVTT